jgi:hypothetical protein
MAKDINSKIEAITGDDKPKFIVLAFPEITQKYHYELKKSDFSGKVLRSRNRLYLIRV